MPTSLLDKRYIQPAELRGWWRLIRPGLERIKEKSTEAWIPEDVYADCFEQRSMLWFFLKENRPVGFVILQPVGPILHIWCAYAIEEDCLFDAWEHIQEIAKQGGATSLSFDSNRRGWDRMAKKLGFKPRRWIKEL